MPKMSQRGPETTPIKSSASGRNDCAVVFEDLCVPRRGSIPFWEPSGERGELRLPESSSSVPGVARPTKWKLEVPGRTWLGSPMEWSSQNEVRPSGKRKEGWATPTTGLSSPATSIDLPRMPGSEPNQSLQIGSLITTACPASSAVGKRPS